MKRGGSAGVWLALPLLWGCAATVGERHPVGSTVQPPTLTAAPARAAPGQAPMSASTPPALHLRCSPGQSCPAAVGMLVFPGEPAPERCTATLIAPDRVLTASHCLSPSARRPGARCEGAWVAFAEGDGAPAEWVACRRVLRAADVDDSHALRQDHAVIELTRAPARAPLAVDARRAEPGAIVTVVSVTPHPVYGTTHRLDARLCRVEDAGPAIAALGADAGRVGWLSNCPIEHGNSGSPVLDYEGRVRAIVHGGTDVSYALGVTSDVSMPPERRAGSRGGGDSR